MGNRRMKDQKDEGREKGQGRNYGEGRAPIEKPLPLPPVHVRKFNRGVRTQVGANLLGFVDGTPTDNRAQDFGAQKHRWTDGGHIAIKNYEVSQHAGSHQTLLLLSEFSKGGTGRVSRDGLFHRNLLIRKVFFLPVFAFPSDRSIQTPKRRDGLDRIVVPKASETPRF